MSQNSEATLHSCIWFLDYHVELLNKLISCQHRISFLASVLQQIFALLVSMPFTRLQPKATLRCLSNHSCRQIAWPQMDDSLLKEMCCHSPSPVSHKLHYTDLSISLRLPVVISSLSYWQEWLNPTFRQERHQHFCWSSGPKSAMIL